MHSGTAEYFCPCCGKPGERAKHRNLRLECYRERRRREYAKYPSKYPPRKPAPINENQQTMRMNDAAIALLGQPIIETMQPCPRHPRS